MTHRIVIQIELGEPFSETWRDRVHRFLNLSDALLYAFRDGELASHEVQSKACSQLAVKVKSAAKIRRVEKIVESLLREHFPDGIVTQRVESTAT